jgi:hypothetical protein
MLAGIFLRTDEYECLTQEDSPWAREELQSLAWEAGKEFGWEDIDECSALPI